MLDLAALTFHQKNEHHAHRGTKWRENIAKKKVYIQTKRISHRKEKRKGNAHKAVQCATFLIGKPMTSFFWLTGKTSKIKTAKEGPKLFIKHTLSTHGYETRQKLTQSTRTTCSIGPNQFKEKQKTHTKYKDHLTYIGKLQCTHIFGSIFEAIEV